MSDSDMDIDDDDVQLVAKHTIAGQSELLDSQIKVSDFQNDVKKHSNEQSKIIMDSYLSFQNSQTHISGNIGKNIKLEDEKGSTLSRFPAPGTKVKSFPSGNEPEKKRPAIPCKFFAKGCCTKGSSCRFLHVNDNLNRSNQEQVESNISGSSGIQSVAERRASDSKEGLRVSLLSKNGVTSSHTREDISLVNLPGVQRVFPSLNEMRFMSSGRESLKQKFGADVSENRSLFINNSNPFSLQSRFVEEHRPSITSYRKPDMESSGLALTGSLFGSTPMNEYASNMGLFENRNSIYGSVSLPMLQGISVGSDQDGEGNTPSDEKKVPSNDWEPSEAFQPSFTIPPYILPSSDALYDPFTDIENVEDRSLNDSLSSKGKQLQNKNKLDGDTANSPQDRGHSNDDKSSSCSQNKHQETTARKNLDSDEVIEGVATSVVDQNDATTPSKEVSSSAAIPEKKSVIKRSKPAGHESWHKSDGSSHQKMVKSDEIDGEVRSDAGMKVMRQFRTTVVETIKEMLKPLWREGRLTKDVHNMVVKKATEKIVSTAVQTHQVPTGTESIEQYLSMAAPKIVKLVEDYVAKYGKPIKSNAA